MAGRKSLRHGLIRRPIRRDAQAPVAPDLGPLRREGPRHGFIRHTARSPISVHGVVGPIPRRETCPRAGEEGLILDHGIRIEIRVTIRDNLRGGFRGSLRLSRRVRHPASPPILGPRNVGRTRVPVRSPPRGNEWEVRVGVGGSSSPAMARWAVRGSFIPQRVRFLARG